jgi:hypothetical protein
VYAASFAPLLGGTGLAFDLTSECVLGQKLTVTVLAGGLTGSFGAKATGTISDVTFLDLEAIPRAEVFNGKFMMSAAGGALGIGAGVSVFRLGGAYSTLSGPSPEIGLDLSISGTIGISRVVDVIEKCCQ